MKKNNNRDNILLITMIISIVGAIGWIILYLLTKPQADAISSATTNSASGTSILSTLIIGVILVTLAALFTIFSYLKKNILCMVIAVILSVWSSLYFAGASMLVFPQVILQIISVLKLNKFKIAKESID